MANHLGAEDFLRDLRSRTENLDQVNRSSAIAIGLLAGASAALPRRGAAQTSPRSAPIRLGAVAVDSYAEPFYARDTGAFERAGLDVQIATFTSSGPMAAAAAGGAMDVGMTDVSVLANAVGRGLPFVVLAGGGLYAAEEPTTVLCVAKAAPYRNAKDLEGSAIAVSSLVSLSSTGVKAWLVQGGVDLAKIRLVEMPPPTMGAALDRGTIGAAFIAEPALSDTLPLVRPFANCYDAIGRRLALNNWFTTVDWLQRNPETAKRLVRCIYETAAWANHHRSETAAILAKQTTLDVERIQTMRRAVYATSLDPGMMQPVLDAAYTYKTIDRRVNANDLLAKL